MHFIQTIFLAGFVAIAIPLVIHLIKSNRAQQIWLGSLRFLEQAMQLQRRRKNWRERLLLLLRLLLIIALVLLFARPFDYSTSEYNPNQQAMLIMLDVSGSMSGKYSSETMLENAKAKINQRINESEYKGEIIWAVFADQTKEISAFDSIPETTGCGTNYRTALEWAQNRLIRTGKKHLKVLLVTDCQKSGLMELGQIQWPASIELKIERILPAALNNVGIQSIVLPSLVKGKTNQMKLKWNRPDTIPQGKMQWLVNQQKQRTVRKQNSIIWKAEKKHWFNAELVWQGEDAYTFDNHYFCRDYVRSPQIVHLINGKNGTSRFNSSTYFIQKALTVQEEKDEVRQNLLVSVHQKIPANLGHLLAFCDGGKMTTSEQDRVKHFVQTGGSLIYFLGSNTKVSDINTLHKTNLFPAKISTNPHPISMAIDQWNLQHAALSVFKERSGGGLNSIIFHQNFLFDDYQAHHIIASYSDGTPAIMEMILGKGHIIVVSNPVNRDWTDWSIGRLFLPLTQELCYYLTDGEKAVEKPEYSHCQLLMHPQPGIYNDSLVVNVDPQEHDVTTVSVDEFYETLGINPTQEAKLSLHEITRPKILGEERPKEWTPLFAFILAGLLFIELTISYVLKK